MKTLPHIPEIETIPKIYWTIGEVARIVNVPAHTVRFWMNEFGFDVHRSSRGNRMFKAADIAKIKMIQGLLKVEKYTLAGAKIQFEILS